jgi:hypothetical protein
MEPFAANILSVINQIKGGGDFVTNGSEPMVVPGLMVNDALEISFPIAVPQIEALIKMAHKAPFGKGSKTIVDTNVRSVWEIDASKISFLNPAWHSLLASIVKKVKAGLGIEKMEVAASFYKLLIYEKGDFFVAHKDSEKEKGMFGTLIIGLPSKHTGGQLCVRFDGKEQTIGFEEAVGQYQIPFAAFYADCEHAINTVTSGHRVCLAYNLIQKESKGLLQLKESKTYVQQIADLLKQQVQEKPMVILLNHQYTPENFSLTSLKHNDRHKTDVIMRAAEEAGYYVKLVLFTCYKMGEMEGDFYYEREGSNSGDGEMGEVHEEYTHIEHWANDGLPGLGNFKIDETEVIRDFDVAAGDPIAKEEEGYMGNYGMTVEYWYHYGAVVLWRKEQHVEIVSKLGIAEKLNWLRFYAGKDCDTDEMAFIRKTFAEIASTALTDYDKEKLDYNIVAVLLVQLNANKYVQSPQGLELLVKLFNKISIGYWEKMIEHYGLPTFKNVFLNTFKAVKQAKHLLQLLHHLSGKVNTTYDSFITGMLQDLPISVAKLNVTEKANTVLSLSIVDSLIKLSRYKNEDADWVTQMVKCITATLTRSFVNKVLADALLLNKDNRKLLLYAAILKVCKQYLKVSIGNKPIPPATFTRHVPDTFTNKKMLAVIATFMASPTEEYFDYRVNQQLRDEMANAVTAAKADLKMETIKKGTPHTLRLIKTQASYVRLFNKWQEDVAYLERLEAIKVG